MTKTDFVQMQTLKDNSYLKLNVKTQKNRVDPTVRKIQYEKNNRKLKKKISSVR